MRQLLRGLKMGRRATFLEGFWDRPLQELFQLRQTTPAGLTTEEASRRLRVYGPNSLAQESRFAALFSFFGFFANPLVIITPPPASLLGAIAFLAVTYLFLVQIVKSWFYRRHALL
jgi:magnesium-transporting ATPase (P-type)